MRTTKQKPAILIVTENLDVGGAEKYTVLIANELLARGYRVIVLANDGPFRSLFHPSIRFVRVLPGLLYGALQIARVTLEERVALVHAQKLESSHAAWIARFVTGVPVVKTAHGYTPKELLTLGRRINRYADLVVTVVDWLAEELEKNGVEKRKLRLVYNGMAPMDGTYSIEERTAARERLGIAADGPLIVSVSRFERGKNHAEFLEWFPRILARVPNAKYLIVGNGPEKDRLIRITRELGLTDTVRFVEGTVHAEPYLRIADIFCTPAVAQGMAVLEAMATGLPVVGTTPKSGPEVVVDGETGFVVTKHDGDAFVSRLTELALNPERMRRFGAAGRVRQQERFPLAKTVDELERAYASVLRKRISGEGVQ
jgi:glycosyltransferase involved in cell wall biosynthesis